MLLLHSSLTQPETWTKLSPGASRIRTKALAPGAFLEPSPAMLFTEKPSILAGTGKPQGRFLASHYLVNKVHSRGPRKAVWTGKDASRGGLHPASVSNQGIRFNSLSCQGKPLSKPVSILQVGRRLMLALKLSTHS